MATEADITEVCQLNIEKDVLTAENYAQINPAMARFLMAKAEFHKKGAGVAPSACHTLCHYCGSLFRPGNYTARVRRRMQHRRSLERLVEHQNSVVVKSRGRFQRGLADLYRESTNRVVLHCKVCLHRTVIPGQRRADKQAKHNKIHVKTASLTHAAKRKLKKKEKRRLKASEASRADTESTTSLMSLDSVSSDSGISTKRSLSSVSSLNDESPMPILPSSMTSTPVPDNAHKQMVNDYSFQFNQNSTTLSSIHGNTSTASTVRQGKITPDNSSSQSNASASSAQRRKKAKSGGPVHNVLKRMLADDLERKNSNGSSLHKFLSGL